MPFTYTGDPANVPMDAIRLLYGDTDANDPLLQDGEIQLFMGSSTNNYTIASACARTVSARFARLATTSSDGTSIHLSNLQKQFENLAAMLEGQALQVGGAVPYAGGISVADKLQQQQNNDRVTPNFVLGIEDNPNVVPIQNVPWMYPL